MSIKSIAEAIKEAGRLLSLPEYQNAEDAINIARILIAQVEIIELEKYYTNTQIAALVGVNEKTIRFWRDGDQCPTLERAHALDEVYISVVKAKRA